jgi:ATP/maltotriose-dependent transcriptional regulator MalT
MQGRFADARDLLARARDGWEQLGNRHYLAAVAETEGVVNHLMGDLESAARAHIEAFEAMRATGDLSFASTQAVGAGAVMLDKDDLDEAWRFATIGVDTSSSDDVISQAVGRAIQARVLARRGEHDAAEALAREAEAIIGATDYLVSRADIGRHLAHVLHDAGRTDDAVEAAQRARGLYDRKGATFFVERIDRLIREWEGEPG